LLLLVKGPKIRISINTTDSDQKGDILQMGRYDPEKRTVLAATHWLAEHGYLGKRSSGGNVSLKVADQDAVAITPSGRPYLKMAVEDVCVVMPFRAVLSSCKISSTNWATNATVI